MACHVAEKEAKVNLHRPAQAQSHLQHIDIKSLWTDTPLEDLLSQAPAAPYTSTFHITANTYNPAFSHPPLPEHDVEIPQEAWTQIPRQPSQLRPLRLFPARSRSVMAPSVGQSALSTHISTSSIQRRLPQYSVRYLKNIVRLLDHSVFEASAAATTVAHSVSTCQGDTLTSDCATITAKDGGDASSTESMFPGIFLVLDRCMKDQGLCIPGLKSHDNKSCWCAVLEELGPQRAEFWPLEFMSDHFDVNLRDEFDNTTLHLLAARGASWSLITDLIDLGADINAKNVTGQNFLHVWSYRSFLDHTSIGEVLERLESLNFEFNHCDFFGRTFFHILFGLDISPLTHGHLIDSIKNDWWSLVTSTRDAFGRIPHPRNTHVAAGDVSQLSSLLSIPEADVSSVGDVNDSAGPRFDRILKDPLTSSPSFSQQRSDFETKMYQHRRSSIIQHKPAISDNCLQIPASLVPFHDSSHPKKRETSLSSRVLKSPLTSLKPVSGQRVNFKSTPRSSTPKTVFKDDDLWKHARLIETARLALDIPWIEEQEGRNGLQCIAEAVLDIHVEDGKVVSSNACKRKRGQPEIIVLSLRLHLRYELVKSLVSSGVNVNNYDSRGSTVLMAFVTHLPDGEDDKAISKILEHLLRSGANLHWKNREGETALHIAVCLGRKVATRVLLDYGANIHARTADGTGILLAAEHHYLKARENPQLYASIWACMALVTDYGAKRSPTLVQEWSFHKTNSS